VRYVCVGIDVKQMTPINLFTNKRIVDMSTGHLNIGPHRVRAVKSNIVIIIINTSPYTHILFHNSQLVIDKQSLMYNTSISTCKYINQVATLI
jgi:hypothetical protein